MTSASKRRPQRQNENQCVLDVVQGFGIDRAEALQQPGPRNRAQASAHCDAAGVDSLIR